MDIATSMRFVADITRVQAATRPEEIALVFEGRTTTFAELDRRVNQVANGLLQDVPRAQTRIALLDTNSDAFFEVLLGAAKANHVLVSVNWRLSPAEIAYIINDSAAETLFVGAAFVDVVESIRDTLALVSSIIVLEGSHHTWLPYTIWRDRQSEVDPMVPTAGSDVAMQVYTSGTTGRPKGVLLTSDNIFASAPSLMKMCGRWSAEEVSLVCLPLFHVGGCLWGLVCLYSGVKNVIVRHIVPANILRTIAEYRVTKTSLVPAIIRLLIEDPAIHDVDLSRLDLIIYGASPMPLELLRRALTTFQCRFGQVYGLTETTGAITYLPPEDHDPPDNQRLKSCGKPLWHTEIRIIDAAGQDVAVGQVGEIVCRTPQNMKGYWHLTDHDAPTFHDEWLLTGDAGYLDADGYLYIHDRIKDVIITGGENVYPAEVEDVICSHPAIDDVAVIGIPDEQWGEAVKAIVIRKPAADVTATDIVDHVRHHLGHFKAPRTVDFVDALPRNAAGKILKRVLREPYWTGQWRRVN